MKLIEKIHHDLISFIKNGKNQEKNALKLLIGKLQQFKKLDKISDNDVITAIKSLIKDEYKLMTVL